MPPKSTNKKTSSRKERKGNACTFCGKVIKKIGDHLQQQHADENVIKEISNLNPKDPEKRKQLGFLVSQGNFKHNEKVLRENNGGQLIPKYKKSKSNETSNSLVSCEKCGSYYSSELSLKSHRCPAFRHLTVNLPRMDLTQVKTTINADHVPITLEKAERPTQSEISSRIETEKLDVTLPASNIIEPEQEKIVSTDEINSVEVKRPEIFSKEPSVESTCTESSEIMENATHIADKVNKFDNNPAELKDDLEFPIEMKKGENLHTDVIEINSTDLRRSKQVLWKSKQISIDELLDSLQDDEIREIIRTDKMILMFADEKLRGVSTATFNNNYQGQLSHIRQIMRRAGWYLHHVRQIVGNLNLTLEDSFKNHTYHHILPEIGSRLSENYTKPFNIDNTRKALGNMLKVFKLRQDSNEENYNRWCNIRARFADSWQSLNEQARTGKREMHKKKKMCFPSRRDYKRLLKYLEKNLKKYMKKNITTYGEYLQLCRLVVTKNTLFNHRRSGEVARMTVEEFKRRDKEPLDTIKEFKDQLTKLEIASATSVDIVTLKGKSAKNELVLAILLPEDQNAISKILECRNQFSSLDQNKFIFAIDGGLRYHLNGNKAIKKIVTESGVKNVSVFTAGIIRKNLCTKMISMDLDEVTKKLLISQLGHKPSIHKDVYEEHMRSELGQFTKLSAELVKIHNENKGMIDEDKMAENLQESSNRFRNHLDESESSSQNVESETSESDTDTEDECAEEKIPTKPQRSSDRLQALSQKRNYNFSSGSEKDDSSESEYECRCEKKRKMRKIRKISPQKRWNPSMNRILEEIFRDELQNKDLPIKKKKLEECQLRLANEGGNTVSKSSIKGKLWQIKRGNYRRLETK